MCRTVSHPASGGVPGLSLGTTSDTSKPLSLGAADGQRLRGAQTRRSREVAAGTVKWFNTQKGYGFIEQSDGGTDAFVHVNSLAPGVPGLAEGQAVSFDITEGRKGPQAVNVRPA